MDQAQRERIPSRVARPRTSFVEVTRPEQFIKILHRLVMAKAERKIEAVLARLHPADIARVLTFLPVHEAREIVRVLFRMRKGAATVKELPSAYAAQILPELGESMTREMLSRLEPDDAADLLQELPEADQDRVLSTLDTAEVQELKTLLSFEEGTAGAIMNPEFFALPSTLGVDAAIQRVREAGDRLAGVFYVYVLDEDGRLAGTVSMRDLLLAPSGRTLADIVNPNVVSASVDMHEDQIAEMIAKYDLLAIPVVDSGQRLIGVITVDDVVDVIQEAATEDVYRMAALDESDRVFTSPLQSARLRIPWLVLNFLTAVLASWVVSLFEDTITRVVVLATMMPMVAGMGGNAGTQTQTVVIRALTLGELRSLNALRAIGKEILVGLINGLALGLLAGLVAWLWQGQWWLGLLLGTAMVINLVAAAIAGAAIPLALKRFGADPALASTIFMTTVTDVVGFLAFLGLATWWLPLLGAS